MYLHMIVYAAHLWGGRKRNNFFHFERRYVNGKHALQLENMFPRLRKIIYDLCLYISLGILSGIYMTLQNSILF